MKMTWRILCATLLVSSFLKVPSAQAASIGISPAEADVTVLEGTTQELQMTVLRSEAYGEQVFSIAVEGDPVLALTHGTSVTLEDGAHDGLYSVTVGGADVAVGDYETTVRFSQAPSFSDTGTIHVMFGASANVHVHVVDRADYLTYLHDQVIQKVEIHLPESSKTGDMLTAAFSVYNAMPAVISGLTYQYILSDASGEIAHQEEADVALGEYENSTRSVPFSLPHEGSYTLAFRVFFGGDLLAQTEQTFVAAPPEPIHWFPVATALLLTLFGFTSIVMCYRRKI